MLKDIPSDIVAELEKEGISELRPAQEKAVEAGLFRGNNLLVCTPTASGKTLIAEMAMLDAVFRARGKCIYVVPLKALAREKFKDFRRKYSSLCRIALSIGDADSKESRLAGYDIILCTAEKLDSLLRHHSPWLSEVSVLVIDEIHLLNDVSRGPTLEIIITIIRRLIKGLQVIALSATIGNPEELSGWLDAVLVQDDWRPVELHKGVYLDNKVEFY